VVLHSRVSHGSNKPFSCGRRSFVPWVPSSCSLDLKRPYSRQGKATPCEEHSRADVKGHNIWQAMGDRSYSCHSDCMSLGFQR